MVNALLDEPTVVVPEYIPQKQGLRQRYPGRLQPSVRGVPEYIPQKQGLRPFFGVISSNFIVLVVPEYIPQKQGLRQPSSFSLFFST